MTALLGTKPLILYPALGSMTFNWSSESAWSGNNWLSETGGADNSRSNTEALFGSYSVKSTGSADRSVLNRFDYSASVWGAVNSGPYSYYCWVKPTAYTGAAALRLYLSLTKAAGVALTTPSATYADYAFSTMTLNGWNLVRVVAPELTTAQQSEFVSVDLRVQLIANGGSATFYADGHHFGYAVDFSAMTGAGSATGAGFVHPYKIRKHVPTDLAYNQYGIHWGRRYNTGYFRGEIETTGFGNSAKEKWSKFIDLSATGSPFTLMYDRSDMTKNFYTKAVMDQDDDGLSQIKGTPNWSAKFRWVEQII